MFSWMMVPKSLILLLVRNSDMAKVLTVGMNTIYQIIDKADHYSCEGGGYESMGEESNIVAHLYNYNPEGGTLAFRLREFSDAGLVYYADPHDLSGAPAESFSIAPDSAAVSFMENVPESAEGSSITRCEFGKNGNDNPMIRVYIHYVNAEKKESSFYSKYSVYALQDGYSLNSSWTEETVPEEENLFTDIPVGEGIDCAFTFTLRGNSPVAVLVKADFGDVQFGQVVTPEA